METTLFEVKYKEGRIFRVFCRGKNQKKRFLLKYSAQKESTEYLKEITNGIHTIKEFEQLCNSN